MLFKSMYEIPPPPEPVGNKKVLLVGWDAADWKIINKLMDEGKMPALERMVSRGVMGNLATLYPDLSPMLWTSIATGKRPFKHGIHGFTEPNPHGGGIRPITNLSRTTKAVWNILNQVGKKSIVVGWWPSHPAEPINGVMVSNRYQRAAAPKDKPWPMPPGTIHPRRLIRNLAELRTHPVDLDPGLIGLFLPKLAEIDQKKDRRVESLAKIIADVTTIKDAVLAVMRHEPWDFCAVYFDGIDHFCHGFMDYHPPKLPWTPEEDFEKYKLVVESGYRLHDIFLDLLIKEAGEEATVILVSDHGFHSDHLRPAAIPKEPAGPAAQHRHYGIFAIQGPGIKKDEIVYGAGLLDVAPTILALYGLPVGEDMDGKPLVNVFESPPRIETIPGWDKIEGDDGCHPPDTVLDAAEAQEAVNQMVALGYIDKPDENQEKAAAETVRELHYNLARSYMDAQRHLDAIEYLEVLVSKWPDEYRFGLTLATCYQAVGRIENARPVIEALFKRRMENRRKAVKSLKEFLEQNKGKKPDDITVAERRRIRNLRAEAARNPYALEYLMGSMLFSEGDREKALVHLKRAEKADAAQPSLFLKIGEVYLAMKQWREAEEAFARTLELDTENAQGHLGLAQSYLPRRGNKRAAEAALDAVGLLYHNPRAHFVLGVALHRMGRIPHAVEALNVAVSQNPNFPEAYRRLAYIYQHRIKDMKKAESYRKESREAERRLKDLKEGGLTAAVHKKDQAQSSKTSDQAPRAVREIASTDEHVPLEDAVVVVSGLPRSGTSMMMQMLDAGGLTPLTDQVRRADEDNPKGYFEYEPVRKLRSDNSWLPEAKGKTVKIVAQLLPHLPPAKNLKYRVIFMERSLTEVIASQHVMLERQKREGANISDEKLRDIFSRQINQIKRMLGARGIPTLMIDYREGVEKPLETARRINRFLGASLDETNMAAVVDAGLYRRKVKENRTDAVLGEEEGES